MIKQRTPFLDPLFTGTQLTGMTNRQSKDAGTHRSVGDSHSCIKYPGNSNTAHIEEFPSLTLVLD